MTVTEQIKYMMVRFHILHKSVLSLYLSLYFNQPKKTMESAIHKAAIGRHCYELGDDFIAETYNTPVDDNAKEISRAVRVALEFMSVEETDFMKSRVLPTNTRPTLLSVIIPAPQEAREIDATTQSSIIEVQYLPLGSELAICRHLSQVPVPKEERQFLHRIAIVETNFQEQYIKKVGFTMLIHFGKDKYTFVTDDVHNRDMAHRWDDVSVE